MTTQPLSKKKESDSQRYNRILITVNRWREDTAKAMAAIYEAHEHQIWRGKYYSWKEFCEKALGFTKRWGNEIVATLTTIKEIENISNGGKTSDVIGGNSVPTLEAENKEILQGLNPAQRKKLDGLEPEQKAEVFHRAVELSDGESPTPKLIEEVRKDIEKPNGKKNGNGHTEAPEKKSHQGPPRDETGYLIPEEALETWKRRSEIQEHLTAISKVRTAIKHGHDKSDPLYRAVYQLAIDHLSRAYEAVADAKPYAVCLYCQGHWKLNNGCRNCHGTGLASKHTYEIKSDQGIRKVREAGMAKKSK